MRIDGRLAGPLLGGRAAGLMMLLTVMTVALGVPIVGVAAPKCTAGAPELYCAEAVSEASLDCTVATTEFTCNFAATHYAAASTDSSAPGQLLAPVEVEVVICNGPGPCEQTMYDLGTSCSWDIDGHGCDTVGPFTRTASGELHGCLYALIFQRVRARARAPGVPLDLAFDTARSILDFNSCP